MPHKTPRGHGLAERGASRDPYSNLLIFQSEAEVQKGKQFSQKLFVSKKTCQLLLVSQMPYALVIHINIPTPRREPGIYDMTGWFTLIFHVTAENV